MPPAVFHALGRFVNIILNTWAMDIGPAGVWAASHKIGYSMHPVTRQAISEILASNIRNLKF